MNTLKIQAPPKTIVRPTHVRTITAKFFGPSNVKGSRIRLHDLRHDKTVWLEYDHQMRDVGDQVFAHLAAKGIEVCSFSWMDSADEVFYHTQDFATRL